MSMLRRILGDMFGLFFPPQCPVCGDLLADNEHFICTACRFRAPLTNFWKDADNPMIRRMDGLLPVENAAAFWWFIDGSDWQRIIHRFKYAGRWRFARRIGEWFGSELAESGTFSNIDIIVPVPLHWRKRIRRGYNQSEYIADGIAEALGAKVDRRSVRRRVNNPSQARNSANERWDNVDGIFAVRNAEALRGKHILLVDDVFTTGATMVSCGTAIIEALGAENVRLSIATVAITQRSMAIDR